MTYPIKIYGVEMYSVRGWTLLKDSLNEVAADCESMIGDYTSRHYLDADDFRVRALHITPTGKAE